MASILNADTTNGLKISSDTSGEIEIQSDGTTQLKIRSDDNIAIGQNALSSGSLASTLNTAVGRGALQNATTSGGAEDGANTAIGRSAMQDLTTGYFNTSVGTTSLQKTTSGYNNSAVGRGCLNYCTTGYDNTAMGREALYGDEITPNTGHSNVAMGVSAHHDCSTGYQNVAIGRSALSSSTTGHSNTAIGYAAGNTITTGNNNILIGHDVDVATSSTSNTLNIGDILTGNLSNGLVYIPAAYTFTTAGAANLFVNSAGQIYRSTSSINYKTNIEDIENQYVNTFFENARPVWYQSTSEMDNPSWGYWGFIAEELDQVDKRLVSYNAETQEPDGVQYERVTVLLTAKVQELMKTIEDLEARIQALENA